MGEPVRFRSRHGIIVALDADSVDACKKSIDFTTGVEGVVGYKLGMTTVLRLGLAEAVRQLRGEAHPALQVPDCEIALAHGTGGSLATRMGSATLILGRSL